MKRIGVLALTVFVIITLITHHFLIAFLIFVLCVTMVVRSLRKDKLHYNRIKACCLQYEDFLRTHQEVDDALPKLRKETYKKYQQYSSKDRLYYYKPSKKVLDDIAEEKSVESETEEGTI